MADAPGTKAVEVTRPPPRTGYFVVRVLQGPDAGASITLDDSTPGRCLVGTSPACPFLLTDPHVSRRHLALEVEGDTLRVVDLGSLNGTRSGGVQVVEALLRGGEQLTLGRTTMLGVAREEELGSLALSERQSFGRVVGASLAMRRIYPLCERLGASEVPVLIEGETGTGKEVLAEALHEASPRRDGPFVVFDCSAVTSSLVESHLFGHEKGAFTGATMARKGVFELADGGTLFIDEIGDLELSLQTRLLRAIERGEVCRVGSERWRKVDARILAATRRNLDEEVQAGRFRDDLFYRLAVTRIELPPLRKRQGDISLLANHFWQRLAAEGEPAPHETFERWETLPWPGNVRELHNAVARRVALGALADEVSGETEVPRGDLVQYVLSLELPLPAAKQRLISEFERVYVERVLKRHGGNARKAAEASGIARRYFNLLRARHLSDDSET